MPSQCIHSFAHWSLFADPLRVCGAGAMGLKWRRSRLMMRMACRLMYYYHLCINHRHCKVVSSLVWRAIRCHCKVLLGTTISPLFQVLPFSKQSHSITIQTINTGCIALGHHWTKRPFVFSFFCKSSSILASEHFSFWEICSPSIDSCNL